MNEQTVLGIQLPVFTQLHVLISLATLITGAVVAGGLLRRRTARGWNGAFLLGTAVTALTGFLFPTPFGPAHVIGLLSLVATAAGVIALYGFRQRAPWRAVYAVAATIALYFNCFVAVVQAFQKNAFLHSIAPTQASPIFAVSQAIVLIAFVGLGFFVVRHSAPAPLTHS